MVAAIERGAGPIEARGRAMLLANDPEALIGATLAVRDAPGFEGHLPTMTLPCLVFASEADDHYSGAKECVGHMPNAAFFSLPGLSHQQALRRSDLVLPQVIKFLAKVTQAKV